MPLFLVSRSVFLNSSPARAWPLRAAGRSTALPPEQWGLSSRGLRDSALHRAIPWCADLNARTARAPACYPTQHPLTAAASRRMMFIVDRRASSRSGILRALLLGAISPVIATAGATWRRFHIQGAGYVRDRRTLNRCGAPSYISTPAIFRAILILGIGPCRKKLKAMGQSPCRVTSRGRPTFFRRFHLPPVVGRATIPG